MSYVIQFDSSEEEIEKSFDNNIHIISIPTKEFASKSDAISEYLKLLLESIDRQSGANERASRPNDFEKVENDVVKKVDGITLDAITSSTSNTCFILMPFNPEFEVVFFDLIVPTLKEAGLTSVRADNITTPAVIMEQIRTYIRQARLLIADITLNNPNVMYEVGLAQSMGKPIIFLSQNSNIPFDGRHLRTILYDTKDMASTLQAKQRLRLAISEVLKDSKLGEAKGLLENGLIRASMAIAGIALEQLLNNLILKVRPNLHVKSINEILKILESEKSITKEWVHKVKHAYTLRNMAIHGADDPNETDAKLLLTICDELMNYVESSE